MKFFYKTNICGLKKVFFLLAFIYLTFIGSVYAYDPPIGIPDPGASWGGLHPIDAVAPSEPTNWDHDIPHWYYVNNKAPNASDNGNGNKKQPRKTIPTKLSPGDVVVVEGGPYETTLEFAGLRGSAQKPIWIRGVSSSNRAVISVPGDTKGRPDWYIHDCSYVFFENFIFDGSRRTSDTSYNEAGAIVIQENSDHLAFRHITIKDYPAPARIGNAAIAVEFSSSWQQGEANNYHVFYDIQVTNYQTNWPPTVENSSQGIGLIDGVDHIWILNSYFYHIAEDGIHIIGLHGRRNVAEKRGPNNGLPTYIFVGKSEFYALGENAIDVKESKHVIISQNKMHYFRHAKDWGMKGGAPGDAIVINDEGYENAGGDESASHTWVLYNDIYDTNIGIFIQSGNPTFIIGNVIHDLVPTQYTDSVAIWANKAYSDKEPAKLYISNNTIYKIPYGICITNVYELHSYNNIVSQITDQNKYHYRLINIRGSKEMRNELFYDSVKVKAYAIDKSAYIVADPLLANPDAGDFSLKEGSPAIDAGTDGDVYALYQSLYGVSIERDFTGVTRPQGSKFDIGAYEFTGSGKTATNNTSNSNSDSDTTTTTGGTENQSTSKVTPPSPPANLKVLEVK